MGNIHPALVHFPIALLTVYALLECVRFKRIRELSYWFYVKALLVIIGFASGLIAFQTGAAIGGKFWKIAGPLLKAHAFWARATLSIFGVLAAAYLVAWLLRRFSHAFPFRKEVSAVSHVLTETSVSWILAFAGLIAITLTGALGGAIGHGPDSDPAVRFLVNLLGLSV